MAYDLTARGTFVYGTGLFGQAMSNSTADAPVGVMPNCASAMTIEFRVKGSNAGALNIFWTNQGGTNPYIGIAASGGAVVFHFPGGYDTTNSGVGTGVASGTNWDHIAISADSTGYYAFINGALVGSTTTAFVPLTSTTDHVTLGDFLAAYKWPGLIDDVAIYSIAKYKTAFTPSASAVNSADAGLVALWKLDGSLVNSAGVGTAPGAPTIGTATAGSGSASLAFTAGTAGSTATTGYTAISTPGSFTGTAAASPITVSGLTNGTAYTFTVHATNSIGNSPESAASNSVTPSAAAATAIAVSGPTTGVAGVASTAFTVSANGTITGTVVVTPSDSAAGGTFTPTTVSISSATPTGTFTYTPSTVGAKTLSFTNNGALTNQASLTYTATVAQTSLIRFSPYNWNVTATQAKTINPGAYFRTIFGGNTCVLNFDVSGNLGTAPVIWYRVDHYSPWITVSLAATVTIDVTQGQALYASSTGNGGHTLEVVFKAYDDSQNRWTPQNQAVVLTSITLDAGAVLTLPPVAGNRNVLFFGDSITEAKIVLSDAASPVSQDSKSGWAYGVGELLGAEFGIVGFGSQGFSVGGAGAVPIFGSAFNLIYAGVSRAFTPAPDLIVINQGTNDGTNSISAAVTSVLNAILAAVPSTTKVTVLRPFNGNQASTLQTAVAGITDSRLSYIDTTGFYTGPRLHPPGNENFYRVAPSVANAVLPLLTLTRGTRTPRTITLTLTSDGTTILPNLTGLKWSINDIAVPSTQSVIADSGTGATTNASGVMTLTVNTTVASGGTVWLNVSDTTGTVSTTSKFFSGPVVIA